MWNVKRRAISSLRSSATWRLLFLNRYERFGGTWCLLVERYATSRNTDRQENCHTRKSNVTRTYENSQLTLRTALPTTSRPQAEHSTLQHLPYRVSWPSTICSYAQLTAWHHLQLLSQPQNAIAFAHQLCSVRLLEGYSKHAGDGLPREVHAGKCSGCYLTDSPLHRQNWQCCLYW
jgi:hypothetical protein